MSNHYVIGIDPGITGAIAVASKTKAAYVLDMPTRTINKKTRLDEHELLRLVNRFKTLGATHAYLEKAQAAPGQSAPSMFSYGQTYGALRMTLVAAEVPFTEVTPLKWKRELSLAGGRENKRQSLEKARVLYPEMQDYLKRQKDHGRAEALLIAHWGAC